MLGPQDMKQLANMVDPDANFETEICQVDIEHLDYSYVERCVDKRELYQLLDYLKSGKEGWYPDLERAIMKRIESLDSTVRLLPQTQQELNESKKAVQDELSQWLEEVSVTDQALQNVQPTTTVEQVEIKSVNPSTPSAIKESFMVEKKKNTNRIKSFDYRAWDKLDPNHVEVKPVVDATVINQKKQTLNIPPEYSQEQRKVLAENEKIKGNDCMRAQEYDQAHEYYTNAIQLFPSAAVFNNRALANLKLTQYSDCVQDCTRAIELEKSFKAFLRRSSGYFHLGRYQDAVQDIDVALEMQPTSKEARDLRLKIMEKWKDVDGARFATKKKSNIQIVDVEDITEPEMDNSRTQKKWNGPIIEEIIEQEKIVIEDVEDEDSSDDD